MAPKLYVGLIALIYCMCVVEWAEAAPIGSSVPTGGVPDMESFEAMKAELNDLKKEMAMFKSAMRLKQVTNTVRDKQLWDEWPRGKYCVLANGECPWGLNRTDIGYINMQADPVISANSPPYDYHDATFGESAIAVKRDQESGRVSFVQIRVVACCRNDVPQ